MTFRETVAKVKAKRIRRAVARMYKNHPEQTVAHVNAQLDEASRQEENRHNSLAGSL